MSPKGLLLRRVRASLATLFVLALVLAPVQTSRAASPGAVDSAPNMPVLNWPANGATGVSTSPALSITVSDPDSSNLAVTFYGRPAGFTPGPDFSIVALPDTQNYVESVYNPGGPAIFNGQTEWVAGHRVTETIAFVSHLGDIVNNGDWDPAEWDVADTAMSKLEVLPGVSDDVPFGLAVGKWDIVGGTTEFESHFGSTRFAGRPYYGGHYGSDSLNNYALFDAGGMRFIVINLFCPTTTIEPAPDPSDGALAWAEGLLKADVGRRGIVVCHSLLKLDASAMPQLSPEGSKIFAVLKDNPNLFLMLGGGGYGSGEFLREDSYNGHIVYSMSADYQARANGGNGWLRQVKFLPSTDTIQVMTYSPTLDQFETDENSSFTLPYDMHFQVIGARANIVAASRTSVTWPNLSPGTEYEWYATVNDGQSTTTGPTWRFTTAAAGTPMVTEHPSDSTANPGQPVTFTAAANGSTSVHWERSTSTVPAWTDISGATNTALDINTVQSGDNGNSYRAVFTNAVGSVTTDPAVLTVSAPPVVTTPPANVTVNPGQVATFTAAASGRPVPTIQWQVRPNGGTWTNISGATSTVYSFTAVAADNNRQFRAVFTNMAGTAYSSAATLTVNQPPAVTAHPNNLAVNAGQTATFTAVASGRPVPTVQWQVSTDNGATWADVSGATSTTYGFTAAGTDHGKAYRAVFTNVAGTATSNAATLTVNVAPVVTTPPANLIVNPGDTATFMAAASGRPTPTVQWQLSTNSGGSWSNVSGATNTSYSFAAAANDNGKQFRAVFTNSVGSASSSAATLTVNQPPTITTQPADLTVTAGQTASFTSAAGGSTTWTIQWQVSTNGGSGWSNISGATGTTYSFATVATDNGKRFRAAFTNVAGTAYSNAATLTVNQPPAMTAQPSSQTVTAGQSASFSAAASGSPVPTVQWQVSTDSGATWTTVSWATSTTYSFTTVASDNGKQFRAVFSNVAGSATSNPATLTVQPVLAITAQPVSQAARSGNRVSFSASASGDPLPTVKWQLSTDSGNTWADIPGATDTSYSFTAQTADDGKQFRAVFTNAAGTATSDAATLIIVWLRVWLPHVAR